MVLVKILKRKDASSVIVAVAIALIINQLLSWVTGDLAVRISGISEGGFSYSTGGNWRNMYVQPIVAALLQLIALEIVVRIVVLVNTAFSGGKKR